MRSSMGIVFGIVGLCALGGGSFAAGSAASPPPLASGPAAKPDANPPMVPPAKPGVFTMQKKGANGFHLTVTAHKFTSRSDTEKYLAYRAAELTLKRPANWFTFTE